MEVVDIRAELASLHAREAPDVDVMERIKTLQAELDRVEGLRLRMKIWTDPETSKRYLMAMALMRDVRGGVPISDVMIAYAMRDDDTKIITLTMDEWDALPFFFFQEEGPAPRASTRPLDVIG
jgi:predicted nucleic acid-binding protein